MYLLLNSKGAFFFSSTSYSIAIITYIRNASGNAVAGMAVSFLQAEYESKYAEVSAVLIELAEQIEQRLGFIAVH